MAKLWEGKTDGVIDAVADGFNASFPFDKRLYKEDIEGSIAHARMLFKAGIISEEDENALVSGLKNILADIESGKEPLSGDFEDIHTFVEQTLTARIGDAGKKLHTARSRNDQVALDVKLYARAEIETITEKIKILAKELVDKAEQYKGAIMSGYTHLQRAQPVTFGHHLLCYVWAFLRDADRLSDCKRRLNISPIGSCALAGTTFKTDRQYEAELLSFDGVTENSMDGVADRDYLLELLSDLSIVAVHLSRLSEEIVLWSSWEFKYIELSDAFTTGSSIMPQKKNPDMAELCRGKTGRVIGDAVSLLVTLKGLPMAYNKDMQEDKEALFDAVDTVKSCLDVFAPMVKGIKAIEENMKSAAAKGFINATDVADYLVKAGVPFRTAYKITGEIVSLCQSKGIVLEQLPIDDYKKFSPLFNENLYNEITLEACLNKRTSYGGPSVRSVETQIEKAREIISQK